MAKDQTKEKAKVKRRRTKEEIEIERAQKERARAKRQAAKLKKAAEEAARPKFECCANIGTTIGYAHDLSDPTQATETRLGLVCPACFGRFGETKNRVEWFNRMYALPGSELVAPAESLAA